MSPLCNYGISSLRLSTFISKFDFDFQIILNISVLLSDSPKSLYWCLVINFINKTISRRFISQEIEHKWLVLPPRANTLKVPKILSIVTHWSCLWLTAVSVSTQWRYQIPGVIWGATFLDFFVLWFFVCFFQLDDNESSDSVEQVKLCQIQQAVKLNIGSFDFIILCTKMR